MKDYEGGVTGAEGITTEDTGELDYGRLLERAYVIGLASPSIPSWNQIAAFLESMRVLRDSSGFAA